MQVTKNILRGDRIKDVTELVNLAKERKSVVVSQFGRYYVRPAAFIMNWSILQVSTIELYHSVKSDDAIKSNWFKQLRKLLRAPGK